MPANSTPPAPGAGVTGRFLTPSATRRVGAIGRLWQISSSAIATESDRGLTTFHATVPGAGSAHRVAPATVAAGGR